MPDQLTKAQENRAEVKTLAERMGEILAEPAGADSQLSTEQGDEFDRLHERQSELEAEYTTIEADAEAHRARVEQLAEVQERLKTSRGVVAGKQDTRDIDADPGELAETGTDDEQRYAAAFDAYLRDGMADMDPEQRKLVRTGYVQRPEGDVLGLEGRAQSIAQDTKGGFLVPRGMMQPIVAARLQFGGVRRSRAEVITTGDGREIPWPTYDDTSNTGALLTELGTPSDQDVTVGNASLHAYMYSSKFVKVSWALLQDSEFDVASLVGRIAGERVGRILSTHFTTGDGASKPYGVSTQAVSGVTAASATEIELDELIDLKHSVDPAYREAAQWMFNDTTLKEIKKKKDGEGRYLWQPGIAVGEPNTIDGDPYVVNQQMDNTASTLKSVLYGDFFNYKIRDVSGMQLRRLDERFADSGQVAFLLFSRHDGLLVNAGTNPIKAITQV